MAKLSPLASVAFACAYFTPQARSSAAGGECVARAVGNLFLQYEALAGIGIGF